MNIINYQYAIIINFAQVVNKKLCAHTAKRKTVDSNGAVVYQLVVRKHFRELNNIISCGAPIYTNYTKFNTGSMNVIRMA